MKKLFSLLILFLAFTSCGAQGFPKVKPQEPIIVSADFEVLQINKEEATLFTRQSSAVYKIDPREGMEAEKEYFFILKVDPGAPKGAKTRNAIVLYFEKSEDQVRRDNNAAALYFRKLHPPKE